MTETDDAKSPEASRDGVYREPHWVVLSELEDPLDVAFIEDELTRASIPSTTTRRMDDEQVGFRVMVARTDEARARAVLGASAREPLKPAAAAGKSQRLVWGLALVPGCAHFYAGQTARGAVLLLAFLSCFYWSATDNIVVLGRLVLYWVDALGARASLLGRQPRLWTILAWTAPLWIAAPSVMQRAAPSVYIGSAGRAVCAAEERCGIEMEDDCVTATAAQIGASFGVRPALSECAAFLEGRSCDEAYGAPEDRTCETVPFCAPTHADEEDACISVYDGSAAAFERPTFRHRRPQGWGM